MLAGVELATQSYDAEALSTRLTPCAVVPSSTWPEITIALFVTVATCRRNIFVTVFLSCKLSDR